MKMMKEEDKKEKTGSSRLIDYNGAIRGNKADIRMVRDLDVVFFLPFHQHHLNPIDSHRAILNSC